VTRERSDAGDRELELGHPKDPEESSADRTATRVMGAGGGTGAGEGNSSRPSPPAEGNGGTIRRSLLGGVLGGLAGAGVGALIGGLAGGPIGALIGGAIGLVAGAIIGHLATRGASQGATPAVPGPEHLEIGDGGAPLVADPANSQASPGRTLPAGTRVVITDDGANAAFNASGAGWVKIRVTTGADIGAEGWVLRTQLVSRPETTEVTPEGAALLFTELSRASFMASDGTQTPIPFHYPPDGCYARAYRMAQLLTEKGYASERVFAVSRTSAGRAGLRVETPYAGNVGAGQRAAVTWWYHVAPIIKVRDPQRGLIDVVIDPSMMDGPATIDEWTGRMGQGQSFERKTLEEVRDMTSEYHRNNPNDPYDYAPGTAITFTTPRDTYFPPGRNPDPGPAQEQTGSTGTMTDYARRARVHDLAAAIRHSLESHPADVNGMIAAIQGATGDTRSGFRSEYWGAGSGLKADVTAALNATDLQRVEQALNQP
jgi:hypothetical protein